ncbi:zinc-ribbon domain-containing protein [Chondromyces crocatus]|uniref:DUF4339 domain-containing protein n=1 Tax=Chondromyces crocatus TaxID=52 RepID=A0A0K1EKI9_CHOCO|nr:zinc-ribbon domain-containing protein [Chondromyces crocatus]AKT41384.1 uncharacterized protein CMC5_055840 [Chondromyces crocatus]
MKITCQSCQSKYTVSDEKVQGKTVKIKCRKCGATILVNSSGAVAGTGGGIADPVSAAGVPGDATTYLVNVAEGDQRTLSLPELVSLYQSGAVTADTYVWADGMADWQPLGQVESIVSALSGGTSADVAPAYSTASEPVAAPSAAAAPAYGATSGYGAGPSSGGGVSAEAVAASAPRAARRDPAKPSADLFGAGGRESQRPSDDVATSAPLFSGGGGAGRREENSVLFSLSALTSKSSTVSASPPAKTTARGDDSGLIDLKALAAGAPAPSPAAAIVQDDGGLFQLSAPIGALGAPASAAPSVAPIADTPPKNRGPMFVGVGIAVAGLAIAGAFFAAKGGDPQVQTTGAETPAPVQTTAPTPEPTPEPTPSAIDPGATAAAPTASASASAVAASKPVTSRPASGGSTTKSGSGSGAASKPPTAATPAATAKPPARGNCGCRPDDLMCNMQCSAKGK